MKIKVDLVNSLPRSMWRLAILIGLATLTTSGCLGLEVEEPNSAPTNMSQLIVEGIATATPLPKPTVQSKSEGSDTPQLVVELDPDTIGLPAAEPDSTPVDIGIFLSVRAGMTDQSWVEGDAVERIRDLIAGVNNILAQCRLHLELETAQVIALPERLLRLQGNQEGSWGGHPPPGTENVELFNYQQHERLTDDARELFGYGKQYTSPNTIAVFIVEHITYYAEQQLTAAGGLSFPPNVYHHPDDYPLRDSVLLVETIPPHGLPTVSQFTMAHEIGHMLLNSGDHEMNEQNLMASLGGITLTTEQCDRMRRNHDWLYGDEAVPDPGPPVE